MMELIRQARETLLSTPDTVCLERARLATEGYRMFAGEPVPLKRAKTFAHILQHMTLDLKTHPIFAGNTATRPRAWMLLPEYGFNVPVQATIEMDWAEGFLDGDVIPDELRSFWKERSFGADSGVGHLAPDHAAVLARGLSDFVREAERPTEDAAVAAYRRACAISCQAVIDWAHRYADEAERLAGSTAEPGRAQALTRVSAACRRVPGEPARNLFEALQAIVLVHLAIHIEGHGYSVSPGRLDQLLAPYYRDNDDTTGLLAAFILKLTQNSLYGSHSKTQPITVGGDGCDDLTLRMLDACEIACVPDPSLFLRWNRETSVEAKRKAIEMLTGGLSFPLLIGDEQTVAGLSSAGISPADAANYCAIGCNELGVPARLLWHAVPLHEADLLNRVLDSEDADRCRSVGDVLDRLTDEAESSLRHSIAQRRRHCERAAETVPTPFTSALMHGCIEHGSDLLQRLPYEHLNIRCAGFVNVVNGLSALDAVVFQGRQATISDVRDALRSDFQGADALLRSIGAAPQWGNDDDRADQWAVEWARRRHEMIQRLAAEPGCPPLMMEMVVRSLHHLDGRRLGATPDGRRAGQPLADSIGPPGGSSPSGPTALLNSVRKMEPSTYWPGGYNLNLTLPAGALTGSDAAAKLVAMVDAFFANGGQELQVNCLSVAELRAAQADPDRYPDLLVRVAGFNALFAKLSRAEQNELIARAEAAESY
jgi:pyruvate-formate lyase